MLKENKNKAYGMGDQDLASYIFIKHLNILITFFGEV